MKDKGKAVDETQTANLIADDVTVRLDQVTTATSGYATGAILRNADEEIKLSFSSNVKVFQVNSGSASQQLDLPHIGGLYELGDQLGGGGQGIVYSADDPGLQREVAVKQLRIELNAAERSRQEFINEARLTAALDHPAIIPIYNLCTDEKGGLNLAMKKLNGISLKEYLAKTVERYELGDIKNFDEEAALVKRISLFIKVCEAISYVHSRKIIHCDLKPENIMLGEYGEVYVVDWGIARQFDPPAGPGEKIMGTPRYTSPENLSGLPCDNRSDIYSLGVMLFEIVTLNPAFSGQSATEVLSRVKTGQFNAINHKFGHPISRDLAAIIRKATALEPEQRYSSAGDLTADLQSYRRGAEVTANPDTPWRKLRRWAVRNRGKAMAASAVGITLLLAALTVAGLAVKMRLAGEEHLKNNIIDEATARTVQTAVKIDRSLTHISALLGVLNADLSMVLDLNRPSSTLGNPEITPGNSVGTDPRAADLFVPDAEKISHFPPGMKLDLTRAVYVAPEQIAPAELSHMLKCLRPVVSRMRRTVLKSNPEYWNYSTEQQLEAYRKLQLPVSFCYLTLKNGLHVMYPGNNGVPENYDGRTRPWYKAAAGRGATPVWVVPYHTVLSKSSGIISCAMEITGARDKVHGIVAVDIPISVLGKVLSLHPEKAAFTYERMIISENGEIILRTCSNGKAFVMDKEIKKKKFNVKIFSSMKHRRYGRIVREKNGKNILWVYSFIPAARWIYVEKIDMEKILELNRSVQSAVL